MTRALTTGLIALAGGLLVLASLAGFLLLSETGLQFLWQRIESAAGTALAVRTVEGRLAGIIRLEDVHYRDDALSVSASEMQLEWSPLALLRGRLQVDRLAARGLRYVQGAADPDATPLELPGRIAFPLHARLEALEIDDAAITAAPGASALQIRQARMRVEIHASQLSLDTLTLEAPGLALRGAATLDASGDYPVQGSFEWHASPAGYAPLQASTRVGGSLQRLHVETDLQAPYAASAGIALSRPLSALELSGELLLHATDLAAIHADWPPLQLTAALRAAGTPEHVQLDADFRSAMPQTGPLEGTLQGLLRPGSLDITDLQLAAADRDATLRARGRIDFGDQAPVFELQADWQDLSWPLQQDPVQVRSKQGELTLSGTVDDYAISAQAALDMPAYTGGRLRLAGTGDLQSFALAELNLEALEGTLDGSGVLDWSQDLLLHLTLQGRQLNPAPVLPEWPGRLDLQLETEVTVTGEDWSVQFDTVTASGTLRGFPLQLDSRGSYRPGQLQLGNSRLVSGPSLLQLSGTVGSRLDLKWALDSPDLATLLPAAAGRLSGRGELQGTPAAAMLQATLDGSNLRYRDDRMDSLSLDARIDLSGATASRLTLLHGGGSLAGNRIDRVEIQGSGYPQTHRLALVAETGRGALELDVEGSWNASRWNYRLTRGLFTAQDAATRWQLLQPVAGLVSAGRATLPENCWGSGTARACLEAGHSVQESTADLRIEQLPLAWLFPPQATGVSISGTLQATADVRRRPEQPLQASLDLQTSSGQLVLDRDGEQHELLRFGAGTASLAVDRHGARLDARLPVGEGAGDLFAAADITTAETPWLQRELRGELRVGLPDIAFAGELIPEVSDLHGRVEGQVKLTGTLAAPRLLGTLRVADAGLELVTPGLTLSEVALEISGEESGDLRIDARVRSGEGLLALTGEANLATATPAAQLQIRGEHVQVLNTPEAEIHASPDLAVSIDHSRMDISGVVQIPYARIEPRKLPESAVTVSPDQLIVDENRPVAQQAPIDIYSNVRFILGDAIRFDGLGLKGELRGNVLTTGEPGRPPSASGELSIRDGYYRAYGQDLEIRTGRLLFAGGPLTEPGLDIEAVRRPAADILVGVKVRGNLHTPALTVFSEPGMPQSQQLSWLVLGRDLESNTSAEEKSAMNEAAILLGMSGGEALGKQLGEQLGLDEVSISSEPGGTTTQASLLMGKYLTPELFVSYGIGIFEPVSTLRLLYTLSSRWKLVGEASMLGSAADIFYVVEHGE